jgi:hypothetical protein
MTDQIFGHVFSGKNLTLYMSGEQVTIPNDSPDYERVSELLSQDRYAEAAALASQYKKALKDAASKLTVVFGGMAVEIVHGQLLINGEVSKDEFASKVLDFFKRGLPVKAMMAFIARLQLNPSYRTRMDLFRWIETNNMPITEDGCFIAFKIVREDLWDLYTGKTFLHTVGNIVEMERKNVDDNPNNTCSAGAHFCGEGYLPHYGTATGNRIVILKIAPEDVVAFPYDYNLAKGRAYRYEVIDEMSRESVASYISTMDRVYYGDDDSDDCEDDDYAPNDYEDDYTSY